MSHSMPKAIFLDLDDTIIDFSSGADPSWQNACEQFTAELKDLSTQKLRQAINDYRQWFWIDEERHRRGRLNPEVVRQEIVAGALLGLGVEVPELADRIAQAYTSARNRSLRLFPNTMEALWQLRALGLQLALITNGRAEDQRSKIEQFSLTSLFDYILIEGEFGVGKPDERVYHHVLNQLGLAATDAWMVGDNLVWDVAVPQRLGLVGVWYDVAGLGLSDSAEVRPNHIIRTLVELEKILLRE